MQDKIPRLEHRGGHTPLFEPADSAKERPDTINTVSPQTLVHRVSLNHVALPSAAGGVGPFVKEVLFE